MSAVLMCKFVIYLNNVVTIVLCSVFKGVVCKCSDAIVDRNFPIHWQTRLHAGVLYEKSDTSYQLHSQSTPEYHRSCGTQSYQL